jgi:hypothetical protein
MTQAEFAAAFNAGVRSVTRHATAAADGIERIPGAINGQVGLGLASPRKSQCSTPSHGSASSPGCQVEISDPVIEASAFI